MDRAKIKEWAKNKAKECRWPVLGATLIVSVITGALNAASEKMGILFLLASFVALIISFVLQVGLVKYMVSVKNGKDAEVLDVFSYFNKDIKNILVTGSMYVLMILLYTFCFFIPGIIKRYAYELVPLILIDDPNRNYKEILDLSEKMMNGHKMDFFMLELSFIGWHILAIFTFGILEIWILPYQQLAITKFLCDIKDNYKESK